MPARLCQLGHAVGLQMLAVCVECRRDNNIIILASARGVLELEGDMIFFVYVQSCMHTFIYCTDVTIDATAILSYGTFTFE